MSIKSFLLTALVPLFLTAGISANAEEASVKYVPMLKVLINEAKSDKYADDIGLMYESYGKASFGNKTKFKAEKPLKLELLTMFEDDNKTKFLSFIVLHNEVITLEGTPEEIGKQAFDEVFKRI